MNDTTVMRGLAIIFVVIHHTSTWLGYRIPIGGGGVAIFLLLSGYGLTKSFEKNGIGEFWVKRLTTVFLPWVVLNVLSEYPWICFNQLKFWKRLFLIEGGLWYLQYIFVWYLIFYIVHRFTLLYKFRWYIVGICVLLIFWLWSGAPSECCTYFAMGMFIGENNFIGRINRRILTRVSIVSGILCLIAFSAMHIHDFQQNEILMNRTTLVMYITLDLCVIGVVPFVSQIKNSRFLYFTGLISYEMYLFHDFIYWNFPFYMAYRPDWRFILCYMLFLSISCYLIHVLDKRMSQFINRLSYLAKR